MMQMHSGQLMMILDEARHACFDMVDELAEAVSTYKTLDRCKSHELSQVIVEYLDKNCGRNEALDRAKASLKYKTYLNMLTEAYDRKLLLEYKYEIFLGNIKAITSLTYLKNTELKQGV